jgi:hypothetical protein
MRVSLVTHNFAYVMDKVELNSCNRIENAQGAKQGVKNNMYKKGWEN